MKTAAILAMSIGVFVLSCTKTETETETETKTTGDIKGIIINCDGSPLLNALITLDSATSTNSGADGTFAFVNIKPKAYQITVKKQYYQTIKQTVRVNADESQMVNFTLDSFMPLVTISTSNMTIANGSDSTKVQISANFDWYATSNASSWLICSPNNGKNNTLTISWCSNITNSPRTGIIAIKDEYDTIQTITITQTPGAKSYTFVGLLTSYLNSSAGTNFLLIESNVAWTIKSDGWLSCSQTKGFNTKSVIVSWSENNDPSGNERIGIITVTAEGGYSKKVTYIQDCYTPPYIPPCIPCCEPGNEFIN